MTSATSETSPRTDDCLRSVKAAHGSLKSRVSVRFRPETPMNIESLFLLMLLLQTKHLVFDWLWQPPYEYLNKGTYGHTGGVVHSAKHLLGTWLIGLIFVSPIEAYLIASIDFTIHYHVDWAKMNINRIRGWSPTTSENFWRLTGVDQYLHQLTYLLICYIVMMLY